MPSGSDRCQHQYSRRLVRINVTSSKLNIGNEFSHDGSSLDAYAIFCVIIRVHVEECSSSTADTEPGRASFSSHYMRKWLFHPFLRWINSIWIEIVFSSGKIHTLNVWNSFVSVMIFLSYYKRRKNVHEVFSSLDQFQLKFPNVVFYLL